MCCNNPEKKSGRDPWCWVGGDEPWLRQKGEDLEFSELLLEPYPTCIKITGISQMDDRLFFVKVFSQVCGRCRHFRKVDLDVGATEAGGAAQPRPRPTCNAFPCKIPGEIWNEQDDHTLYPGDQDIQFEDSGVHPPRSTEIYCKGVR